MRLIDADALVNWLDEVASRPKVNDDMKMAFSAVAGYVIIDAPTIDAVPRENYEDVEKELAIHFCKWQPVRHGEWALKMNERFYWKECSVCGHKPPRSDEYGTYIESNFCPNCGAKMDGGGDAK